MRLFGSVDRVMLSSPPLRGSRLYQGNRGNPLRAGIRQVRIFGSQTLHAFGESTLLRQLTDIGDGRLPERIAQCEVDQLSRALLGRRKLTAAFERFELLS